MSDNVVEMAMPQFNLTTALFCSGLAFDGYTEPNDNDREGATERNESVHHGFLTYSNDTYP
jgi:hypothetical protein